MAAKGFIKLLEIAERSRQRAVGGCLGSPLSIGVALVLP